MRDALAAFLMPKNQERRQKGMKTQKIKIARKKTRINWLTVMRNVSILALLGANILATEQLIRLGGW